MRDKIICALLIAIALAPGMARASGRGDERRATRAEVSTGQRVVVDRIVARIEDDILTLSELRELERYQRLANGDGEGRTTSDDELLGLLIDQWIVSAEAAVAQFPHPSKADVQAETARLAARLGSDAAYRARLKELDLPPESVERHVERQIYLARFLDYKLRPTAHVESAAVEKYYREELVPELKKRRQTAPPLEQVEDQIRELLTQREISARVIKWLEDTRARLKIDVVEPKKTP